MIKYKTDPRAPKSIPAKYRRHIEDWSDERMFGNGYLVTMAGLCLDGPGSGDGKDCLHIFGEDTVADVVTTMSLAYECKCDFCNECVV